MTAAADLTDSPLAGRRLTGRLVGFVRVLRDNGFPVGLSETMDGLRVTRELGPGAREPLRWALRSLLCSVQLECRKPLNRVFHSSSELSGSRYTHGIEADPLV